MKSPMELVSLAPDEQRALTALLGALRKRFPDTINRVVLFGSKSRGDSDSESDIDLLIVVNEYSWALEKEISRLATQVDYEYQVVLSDHIVSDTRFEQMAARREPLYCHIEREAIELWTSGTESII
jgi:uncharacterized protein